MPAQAPLPPDFWEDEGEVLPGPPVSRGGKLRTLLKVLLVLVLILVALHTIADQYLLHQWETLKEEHNAVKVVVAEAPPAENALPAYVSAAEVIQRATAAADPGMTPSDALAPLINQGFQGALPELPEENLQALEAWTAAASSAWDPLAKVSGDGMLLSLSADPFSVDRAPALPALQQVNGFLLARAYLTARAGQTGEACDALLLSGQMSLQLSRGPLLVDGMVGRALGVCTLSMARVLLETNQLSESCRELLLQLTRALRDSSQLLNQMRTERDFLLSLPEQPTLDPLGRLIRPYVLYVLLKTMRDWDESLAVLRIPEPEARRKAIEETVSPAGMGLTLAPNLFRHHGAYEGYAIPCKLLEVCLLQVRHKEVHGSYAQTLELLRATGEGLAEDIASEEFSLTPQENGFELRHRATQEKDAHVIIWRD